MPRFIFLLLIIGLLLFDSSCGSNNPAVTSLAPALGKSEANDSTRSAESDISLFDIPIAVPIEILLVPQTPVGDPILIPIFNYNDHVIAWTERESGNVVTTSRVSDMDGATIPPCSFNQPGTYTFDATLYWPFDTTLFFPLGTASTTFDVDNEGCLQLEFEQFELPTVTPGGPEDLTIRTRLVDDNDETFLDPEGNRPPTSLTLQAENGTLDHYEGITDDQGYFRTKATLAENQSYMIVTATAEYQPEGSDVDPLVTESEPHRMNRLGEDEDGGSPGGGGGESPYIPCPYCGIADVVGDPHLYTFDRLRYDFHGVGEYILARSLISDFEVQARFRPFSGSTVASMAQAVAFRLGSHRVMISVDPAPEIRVDGQLVELQDGGYIGIDPDFEYYIQYYGSNENGVPEYQIFGPFGQVTVRPLFTSSPSLAHLEISIELYDAALQLNLRGLLGNHDGRPDNDLTARTGEVASAQDYWQLYHSLGESWRVGPSESLFDYGPGESTATFTDPSFPTEIAQLDPLVRQGAKGICEQSGVVRGGRFDIEDCIFDVAIMGSEAVGGYGGSYDSDSGYSIVPIATVGSVIDLVKDDSDMLLLDQIFLRDGDTISKPIRLTRVTRGGSIVPIAQDLSPSYQRILPSQDGTFVVTNFGELIEIADSGETSVVAQGFLDPGFVYLDLSNLVADDRDVVLSKSSVFISSLRQEKPVALNQSTPGELIRISNDGTISQIISGVFGPSLLKDGQDFVLLTTSQGWTRILRIKPNLEIVVVWDERDYFSNENVVTINDIGIQDSNVIGSLSRTSFDADIGLGIGEWPGGLVQFLPQGQLSAVVRFPGDIDLDSRFIVDGDDFIVYSWDGGDSSQESSYSSLLYRIKRL